MKRSPDKYDEAIAYLREHPEEIVSAWSATTAHHAGAGILFKHVTPIGEAQSRKEGGDCGCLTQIRDCSAVAYDPSLTMPIRRDKKLPTRPEDITLAHLPRFAYWQRKLDKHWKKMEQGVTR